METRRRVQIETLVKSRVTNIAWLILFTAWLLHWWWHVPTPGKAIAVFGFAAGARAVLGEMAAWQKLLWLLVLFTFLPLELRAIDKDRAEYAKEQADVRRAERDRFDKMLQRNEA